MVFSWRAGALSLGLAFVASNALLPAIARAQGGAPPSEEVAKQRATARKLAGEGIELIDQGKIAEGIERLEQAEAKFHALTHLLYLARAYRDLGQLGASADRYERLVGEKLPNYAPDEFREAQKLGNQELVAIAPRLSKIRVVLHGGKREEATISVDEQPAKPLLDVTLVEPGPHHLTVTVGPLARSADVTVPERGEQSVELTFEQAPVTVPKVVDPVVVPPNNTDRGSPFLVPAVISFSIGGAGLITGVATGVASLNKVSDLKKRCPTKLNCSPSDAPLAADARTFGNVSTGAFVIGGIGVAAGVLLVLLPTPARHPKTVRLVRPLIGLGFVGLEGTL